MITLEGQNPNMIANNLKPFEPTHPGEVLKDELEFRGISQRGLARDLDISYTVLNEMLNGKRALNTKLAMMLEAALGVEAAPLLAMQCEHSPCCSSAVARCKWGSRIVNSRVEVGEQSNIRAFEQSNNRAFEQSNNRVVRRTIK